MRAGACIGNLRRVANSCESGRHRRRGQPGFADFRRHSQTRSRATRRGNMRVFAGFAEFAGGTPAMRNYRALDGCRHRALPRPARPAAALGLGRARGRDAGRALGEARPRRRRPPRLRRMPVRPIGSLPGWRAVAGWRVAPLPGGLRHEHRKSLGSFRGIGAGGSFEPHASASSSAPASGE